MKTNDHVDRATPKNRRQLLYVGVCLVVLFSAISAILTLLYLRQEAYRQTQYSTESLASSLVQTFDGMIDAIDVALQSVADEVTRQRAHGSIDRVSIDDLLLRQAKRVPHVAFMRITDERGKVVYGIEDQGVTANLSDRAFFQQLTNSSQTGLVLSQPVLGKIAKRWLWTFARRIEYPDGRFAGIVYASVYADEIESVFDNIQLGDGGSIALRDRDLYLIARRTGDRINTIPIGSLSVSVSFRNVLAVNSAKGTYTSDTTSSDPVQRIYSYHRSGKYGYLVNVGSATEVALQVWKKQVLVVSIIVGIFSFMLVYLARKIDLAWQQYDAAIADLKYSSEQLSIKHQLLINSEQQHLSILEKLHTAIIVHAPDTSIIFSNSRASELLGLTEDQLLGKVAIDTTWHFVHEDGSKFSFEEYPVQRALRTQQSFTELVLGIRRPHFQNILWVQVSAFLEFDSEQKLRQIVVNFNDITERKEAELRWQFALEGAGDGVWDIDLISKRGKFSKTYLEMLGYPEGSFSENYEDIFALIHPEDRSHLMNEMQNHSQHLTSQFSAEYRMLCADGSYKWIYGRGMVVSVNEQGESLRMVGTHTDISGMKSAEEKIWTEANYDALTKLPNRRLFYDRIEENLKKAKREHQRLALLFIDLDRFKEVNDTLGHHVGDQLLIQAATRIKSSVRVYDTVARIGGDEFTVILTEVHDSVDVGNLAEKIIAQLSQPFLISGVESYVSGSIGIALYPDDAQTVIELTQHADQAMYSAKESGRQCFRFFTKTMQEDATQRMRLANDLRHALKLNQLLVYYQPIVDLKNGEVYKAEALVRWQHPELGFISPANFIPIAEDTGTIHQIGDWVFSQAAAQAKICQTVTKRKFQISVNKSPVQFLGERGDQHLWLDQINKAGIEGDDIVIEITEGILVNNDIRVTQSLMQYRDAKVQVAIDDFGTGYSSLSYLKKFDVDYLKIDQSFTRSLSLHSSEFALCEAIIVMAHKLGIQVIAEGVETEEQHQILKEMGCDFGQGYLFARPLPADQFLRFIQPHDVDSQSARESINGDVV